MNKIKEISDIQIIYGDELFYGPDQHWYKKKWDALSGCGPTTAAIVTAHMAQNIDSCKALYAYDFPMDSETFLKHMDSIHNFVKPGAKGLTDPHFFGSKTVVYAASKSVKIDYKVMDRSYDFETVFGEIKGVIDKGILPSLLILRNPHKELDDFTWHWMPITGYIEGTTKIIIATYGKRHILEFSKVWEQGKLHSADIVYFYV